MSIRSEAIEAMAVVLSKQICGVDFQELDDEGCMADHRDEANVALDALLDYLAAKKGELLGLKDGYPDVYEVAPSALPHLEALGLLSHFGRVSNERIVGSTLSDLISVLRVEEGDT